MEVINILVPTDFSDCSKNALKYAIRIAQELKSNLTLMHGYHIPIPSAEMTVAIDPELAENYKKEVEEKLELLKEEIKELDSIPSNFKFVMAFAVEAIMHSIKHHDSDLVIMGTKGASGLQKVLFGSIASSIVQKSPKPVLSVPASFNEFELSNIAIAVDLNAIEDYHLFDLVKLLAFNHNAEIHIINVNLKHSETDQLIEVQKLAAFLGDIPHHYHVVRNKDVEQGIMEYIEKKNINLLTMIPRHHDFLERLFTKSVTKSVSTRIKIPLLTLPE